jgi:hypothetical protein
MVTPAVVKKKYAESGTSAKLMTSHAAIVMP